MKKYSLKNIHLFSVLIMVASLFISGCGSSENETEKGRANRMLKSTTWTLNRLTVDGVDKTADYAGMTLKISDGSYTATNGEPVWQTSGVWKLIDETVAERDDNETVHIDMLTETMLTLSLNWQKITIGEGRASSIKGAYVFEFVKY